MRACDRLMCRLSVERWLNSFARSVRVFGDCEVWLEDSSDEQAPYIFRGGDLDGAYGLASEWVLKTDTMLV